VKADDVKRPKELERENAQLKRIVANKKIEIDALREVAKGRMKVKCEFVRPFSVAVLGASRRRCARRPFGLGASFGARVRGGARG
jgi:hypothetical protein